jgi:hypothetical protein
MDYLFNILSFLDFTKINNREPIIDFSKIDFNNFDLISKLPMDPHYNQFKYDSNMIQLLYIPQKNQ